MPNEKLRRQIAFEAARLLYERVESDYYRARLKAARKVCSDWVKPSEFPSDREIRDEIQHLARMKDGPPRDDVLSGMRLEALRVMRLLQAFDPRLSGSALTGRILRGSAIDLLVCAPSLEAVCRVLAAGGMAYEVQNDRDAGTASRLHLPGTYPIDLTLQIDRQTGAQPTPEQASVAELERLMQQVEAARDLDAEQAGSAEQVDRFQVYRLLLIPLETVSQNRRQHPEGDALYHSLQVFDLARDELPYDEEFQLAALLHDVGKAIDPFDHVRAGLAALDGYITERTAWFIAHHSEGQALLNGTIGMRARRRLLEAADYEELKLLAECDRRGRQRGVPVPEIDDALDSLRDLARRCG